LLTTSELTNQSARKVLILYIVDDLYVKIIVSKLLTCRGNFALKRTRDMSSGEHLLIRRSSYRQCFLLNTSMNYPTSTNAGQITTQLHSDICTAESLFAVQAVTHTHTHTHTYTHTLFH